MPKAIHSCSYSTAGYQAPDMLGAEQVVRGRPPRECRGSTRANRRSSAAICRKRARSVVTRRTANSTRATMRRAGQPSDRAGTAASSRIRHRRREHKSTARRRSYGSIRQLDQSAVRIDSNVVTVRDHVRDAFDDDRRDRQLFARGLPRETGSPPARQRTPPCR